MECAVVALGKCGGVGDDVRLGLLIDEPCRKIPVLSPQQREHFAAAVNGHWCCVRDHGVAGGFEHVDVHAGAGVPAEAGGGLTQVACGIVGGVGLSALEVVADDHRADADGAQRLRVDCVDLPVEAADGFRLDERDGVAEGEAGTGQRLDRLVAGPAPVLAGKGRRRHDEGAGARGVLVEPLARGDPLRGDFCPRALGQQAQRPRRGHGDRTREHHARGPRPVDAGKEVAHAHDQGKADEWVEFVEVAEGGEWAVEKRGEKVR